MIAQKFKTQRKKQRVDNIIQRKFYESIQLIYRNSKF